MSFVRYALVLLATMGATTQTVLVQPEMENRRSPLVSIPPLRGGDFPGMRVHRPMTFFGCGCKRESVNSRAAKLRPDEPPD